MKGNHYDIRDFGAVDDPSVLNTKAVQRAIDTCHEEGGGVVRIAGGTFLTGTLVLKDEVVLEVEAGAVLKGGPDIGAYAENCGRNMYRGEPEMDRCLIFARGARNIGIRGRGMIDGNGNVATFPNSDDPQRNRPMLIRFIECTGVRIRDITLKDPAAWSTAWLYCRDIVVDGITIQSRANHNGDGLDFDGCTDVRVANSSFDTSDDAICLQTSRPDRPCEDIVVTNCTFRSRWAGLRLGLLSRGDFSRVSVSNCTFHDIGDAGLKIQVCEGGTLQNMVFSNLVMERVPRPVFITLGRQRCCVDAPAGLPPLGRIRRLHFHGLTVDNTEIGFGSHFVITGVPDGLIEDVSLRGIDMVSDGGCRQGDFLQGDIHELEGEVLQGHWPEYHCFGGVLPASGLYARHVRGLTVAGCRFAVEQLDERAPVETEDVIFADGGDHADSRPAAQGTT